MEQLTGVRRLPDKQTPLREFLLILQMKSNSKLDELMARLLGETNNGSALPAGSVVLDRVSKRFHKRTITKQSYTTLKGDLVRTLLRRSSHSENFTEALNDFSLRLEPGSSVGVIGRNGSGKSTLLKLISGIYRADTGSIAASGRISALIELGAGFHPDFTGRENIALGGIMYGLSRAEIQEKFARIVSYAELENFIDDPVRTYSSGMYMRLGFSLAVHTEPDILLIDEVLAVGDAAFISRCQETISDFKRQGKTLVLVSHDLNAVLRWCDEAVWLDSGRIRRRGAPREVIDEYLRSIEEEEKGKLFSYNSAQNPAPESQDSPDWCKAETPESTEQRRWGNGDVEIRRVRMCDAAGEEKWLFHSDDAVCVEVSYRINRYVDDLVFGVGILRADGLEVHGANTDIDEISAPLPDSAKITSYPVEGVYRYRIERLGLLENTYYIDVAAHKSDGLPFDYHHRMHKFAVRSPEKYSGVYKPEHEWSFAANYPARAQELRGKRRQKSRAAGE
ncbi:MAG TPA: ABC transporter ATP-binding protein [Oligoflexia bacterium]|nr:ABC transporter ATP-binding protein [Oligoflexia bacterium]